MAQQETVLTEPQADEILSRIPANAQEARAIAWAIAQGWELRLEVAEKEQETPDAA